VKIALKLARVGMTMQEATIAAWNKRPGESFAAGEALYAIETDKVTQEVTAPHGGTLIEIWVQAGETVAVGGSVCLVDVALEGA